MGVRADELRAAEKHRRNHAAAAELLKEAAALDARVIDPLRIRRGAATQADWRGILARLEQRQTREFMAEFRSRRCCTLYETWAPAHMENRQALAALGAAAVAVVRSTTQGCRPKGEEKDVAQLPPTSLLAVGARVVLTKNQGGGKLVRFGLNNGAVGSVVAILYAKGEGPTADATGRRCNFPEAAVVDFPQYTGPPWDKHHPTWVPIPVMEAFDKTKSNGRKGMPLRLGYATVIHKSQGMSIGDGKPIERMRLCLANAITMEASNLGLLYVALSRVEEDSYMVLVEPVDQRRVLYVNSHPSMPSRQAEEARLCTLSAETVARAAAMGLD